MRQFKDIASFIRFLEEAIDLVEVARRKGLYNATQIVWREAIGELGTYQSAIGEYPAWEPLSVTRVEWRDDHGLTPDDPLLATSELKMHVSMQVSAEYGIVGVETGMVGDGSEENHFRDIGEVAEVMENGNAKVPPRPFIGPAFMRKTDWALDAMTSQIVSVVIGMPGPNRVSTDMPVY